MNKRALLLGGLFAVTVAWAGYVTPAAADFFGLGWKSASEDAEDCFKASVEAPEYQAIAARLGHGRDRDPTQAELSDPTMPTEADAQLVQRFAERRMVCRNKMLAATDEYHPALSATYEVRYFQQDLVYVELIKRRISFGEAHKRIHESWLEFEQRYAPYDAKMQARVRQQEAEALDQLARTLKNMPNSYGRSPYAPGGPTTYTCQWIGPSLYCDRY